MTVYSKLQGWFEINQRAFLHSVWIFLLAWIIRLGVLGLGGYSHLGWDERFYMRGAADVLNGSFNENFFLPGWFYILSWAMRFAVEPRVLVTFLGALTAVGVFIIGKNIFETRTGLVAALIFIFYPEHIFYSHYVHAEIMLGLILTVGTVIIFSSNITIKKNRAFLGSFFLGCGLLYKHFVLIPFVSMLCAMVFTRKKTLREISVCVLLFIAPMGAYTLKMALNGSDPFLLLNSPVKSVKEWKADKAVRRENLEVVGGEAPEFSLRTFFVLLDSNLSGLWTPESLPVTRLERGYYAWARTREAFYGKFFTAYQILLMVLGLAGLCFSPKSAFKRYVSLNLIFLTSMTAALFMISRYRLPFMYLLIIYAARLIVDPSLVFEGDSRKRVVAGTVFIGLMCLLAYISLRRIPVRGVGI